MSDSTKPETSYSRKRWLILGLAWVLVVIAFGNIQIIPALSYILVPDLKLTTAQLMMIFTAPVLLAVFASIPGGILGDRFGPRLIIGSGSVIIGLAEFLRGFQTSFGSEFAVSAIIGIGWGCILPNLPRIVSSWFPPREQGLATGIYLTAISAGSILVMSTTALFYGTNWRLAFICSGLASLVIGAVWWLLARNRVKKLSVVHHDSSKRSIKTVFTNKNVWLVTLGYAAFNGCFYAINGITPHALETVHQVNASTAGLVTSMITLGAVISVIFPGLSDRVGLRKPFLFSASLLAFILLFLSWYTAFSLWTWVLIFIGGIAAGVLPALLMTLPLELPGVDQHNIGIASGLITTAGNISGFVIPSYLVPSLQSPDMNLVFLAITGLLALIFIFSLFLPETGSRIHGFRLPPKK
jgi:nitrate/nitrite transporter NarK